MRLRPELSLFAALEWENALSGLIKYGGNTARRAGFSRSVSYRYEEGSGKPVDLSGFIKESVAGVRRSAIALSIKTIALQASRGALIVPFLHIFNNGFRVWKISGGVFRSTIDSPRNSHIDRVPSAEERGEKDELFYESASRLIFGALALWNIEKPEVLSCMQPRLSTKSPLSAACRRMRGKEGMTAKGEEAEKLHWTALADMLIAKLCKEGDCHNSAGGQNDPEPPSLEFPTCPSSTRYNLRFSPSL